MCGCPARGCLEAIPSGGEYESTVSASDPYGHIKRGTFCFFLFFFVVGQMITSARAECALSVDCVEKCSPAHSQKILTSNTSVTEKAGRAFPLHTRVHLSHWSML